MFFYRRQHAQVTLDSSGVVITDVALNHLHEFLFAGETLAVIAFPFQNAPESFHRSIVNAVSHTGHTLSHSSLYEFVVEGSACVLETSIAVEQRVGIWIRLNSFVKSFVNEWIIIALTEHIGHDAPVAKVEDGAQIEFLYLHTLKPLEFGHIGEPLLIGLCGIKLPVQKVFGKILRVLRSPRAAMVVVLDRGTDISGPADAEHPLVIDVDTVVMTQVVIESPVALIRTFLVDLLDRIRKTFILCGPPTQLAGDPSVVG